MVAHTSGEGIYFSMASGRMAAQTLVLHATDHRSPLTRYEKVWQKKYGAMFDFLEFLEKASYTSNFKREFFVDMCATRDVQQLTFDSYLFKEMAKMAPGDHLRMAYEAATRAVAWMRPRIPIAHAPPQITAKEALHATRGAIADGVAADETPAFAG
jgi:geranylgeranyl reductase